MLDENAQHHLSCTSILPDTLTKVTKVIDLGNLELHVYDMCCASCNEQACEDLALLFCNLEKNNY